MNAGIHIEMNILFCMFCILLYFQQKKHNVFDFLGSTTFNYLVWASVGIMSVDTVSWLFVADVIPHPDIAPLISHTLYYMIQAVLPFFFLIYCVNTTGTHLTKTAHKILSIPIFCTVILLLINAKDGFAFSIENNLSIRNADYLLVIIAPLFYTTACFVSCCIFYVRSRKDTMERRKIAFHMLVCVSITLLGAIACTFIPHLSPWHAFVAALVYLYINLHSYHEQSLDTIAYTDSMTGLKNYAAYTHIKEQMVQQLTSDPNTHFAIAVMDVNNLKKVNDKYGHKAGDALLCCASKLLCDVFKRSPVCRIGGDEFVAILESYDYENREALYNAFLERMQTATFTFEDVELPLSAALGLCAYDHNRHHSFDDVFQEADSTMYENKAKIKLLEKSA